MFVLMRSSAVKKHAPFENVSFGETSRKRHKSVPYLKLKIANGHGSVKKLKESNSQKENQTHENPKPPKWRARCPLARTPGALKGGTFSYFLTSIVAKHQKIEGGPFGEFSSKKSLTMPKNSKWRPFSLSRYCMLRRKEEQNFMVPI